MALIGMPIVAQLINKVLSPYGDSGVSNIPALLPFTNHTIPNSTPPLTIHIFNIHFLNLLSVGCRGFFPWGKAAGA
jgi:hypothetical protein